VGARLHLSPGKSADDLRRELPNALGTVQSIDAIGDGAYSLAIDTVLDKTTVANGLRAIPGVASVDDAPVASEQSGR